MTTDREATRIVRSWMADGVDRLPDRVLDAALDRAFEIPQRRSRWTGWATPRSSSIVKVAAGLAAVFLVAFVGVRLGSDNPMIGGPAPTPTPTLVPSPSASPISADDMLQFPAGTYHLEPFIAPLTLTFESSWTSNGIGQSGVFFYRSTPEDFAPALVIDGATRVFEDPCHPDAAPASPSAAAEPLTGDEIVAELQGLEGFTSSPVTDVTLGGRPARTFVLSNAISDAAATECEGSPLDLWESNYGRNTTNQRARDHVWVVDVDGSPVTIDAQSIPGLTPDELVAELEAVVASIQFDP